MPDALPTRLAAEACGVDVAKFHRLVALHGVYPVLEAPGIRGAKFWNPRDVDRIRTLIAAPTEQTA